MEVHIPMNIPDELVRKIIISDLRRVYDIFNSAHGRCITEGETPTDMFSSDPEQEKLLLEKAIEGLDLLHAYYMRCAIDNVLEK